MPLVGSARRVLTGLLVIALLSMGCQSTPATPKPTVAQGPDGPPVAPPSIEPQELEELLRVVADVDAVAASVRADPGDFGERWRPATGQTLAEFMDLVNDDLESFWRTAFGRAGQGDLFQTLVPHFLEEGETGSFACGRASSQDGAYYCHFDGAMEMVIGVEWMDEDIYRAHGPVADFAVATVIAHEWGHHIQHLIGALIGTSPGRCCGLFTVQTELNADCMAGMWAFSQYGRGQLEEGDIAEAVQASEDAGDLPFSPPTRTGAHGQPEQRVEWFTKGFESGSSSACNPILLPGNGVVEVPEGGEVPPTLPPVGPSPTAGAVAGGNQVHNGFLIPATTDGDLSIPEGWIHLESVVGESIADTDAALALVRAQLSLTPPDPWRRFVVLLAPDQTYAVYAGSSVNAEVPTLTGGYLWYWTFGCGFGQWWDGDAYQVAAFDGCGGADPGASPAPDGSAPPEESPAPDGSAPPEESPAPDGSPSPASPEIPSPSPSPSAAAP